ncbi:hypothetical protein K7H20_13860 [Salipiger manganoxidans]|uniref:hypothetical protein n=1 Tax=Salipiger marinus TaxID=555512 RepID=UPI0022A90C81|nr:hypothetical protein [Salipiger manganoxidans]MCD1619151.1 hypothetical protein [Salipiger manganoxidans]
MIQTPRTHTSAQPMVRHCIPQQRATGPCAQQDEAALAAGMRAMAAAEGRRPALPPSPPPPPPLDADGLRVGSSQSRLLAALRQGPGTRPELCDRARNTHGCWGSAMAQIRGAGFIVTHARIDGQTVYRLEGKA